MDFFDFQIRAWREGDTVEVLVHSSPVGDLPRPIQVRVDEAALRELRGPFAAPSSFYLPSPPSRQTMVELGRRLAAVLLPPPVHALLVRSLDWIPPEAGLRVRLCLDADLIDLPWEFLYRPDTPSLDSDDGFLVLDPHISLVRESPRVAQRFSPSSEPQRLLFARASWSDGVDRWGIESERAQLGASLAPIREFLSLDHVEASVDDLATALRTPTAILHYSGHVDLEGKRGYLVSRVELTRGRDADGEFDGRPVRFERVYSDAPLALLLRRSRARLAVFSACNSGRWPFVAPLLREGLPALVGVQGLVSTAGAFAFSARLYAALAVGLSVDEAVAVARMGLYAIAGKDGIPAFEWGSFMVYLPTPDAVLFPRPDDERHREAKRAAQVEMRSTIESATREMLGSPQIAVPSRRSQTAKAGKKLEELCEAFATAFPTLSDLKQMVLFKTGRPLQRLVDTSAPLDDVVFDLVTKAEAEGWLDDLLRGARESNPGNKTLRQVAEKYGVPAGEPA